MVANNGEADVVVFYGTKNALILTEGYISQYFKSRNVKKVQIGKYPHEGNEENLRKQIGRAKDVILLNCSSSFCSAARLLCVKDSIQVYYVAPQRGISII